ncbi:7-cyano-7-deazaguanine synthase [Streptomyces pactum]|uniref:7-cyano-7-deazaguanine synthase n=1 Tax=Streptomyces pactum TaxID=68249 RepID=A0ABS0NGJ9_9ACTN|nr:7-cyano-7-deazaguanine synthase [Streptomyces pactum]MBH5334311.1 7-cyano-7-deazaguanine synthase [Streptomyces pactum]
MTATPAQSAFWFVSPPHAPRPNRPWQPLSDRNFWERDDRRPDEQPLYAPPPPWADDLHRVARAVFLADKHTRRDTVFDQWTRRIRLSVPVAEPERWQRVRPLLTGLLRTMTADVWELQLRAMEPGAATPLPLSFGPDARAAEVALFSGGLDSLSWAARRAAVPTADTLLLVTFGERNFEALQREVLQSVYRRRRRPVRRLLLSQTVRRSGDGPELERSTRSRGFLYATAAIRAAAAEGAAVAHIPENGYLAINPPLSAARSAACSTRSVHPWTLHQLNRLIAGLGGEVRVENPLAGLTKGQVCRAALRVAGLTPQELGNTLSCGTPPPRRPGDADLPHCGVCYPCLVRRAGLLAALGEDGTPYEADPWALDAGHDRAVHWRAVQRWLRRPYTSRDLIADTPLPPGGPDLDEVVRIIDRGRAELLALIRSATTRARDA